MHKNLTNLEEIEINTWMNESVIKGDFFSSLKRIKKIYFYAPSEN